MASRYSLPRLEKLLGKVVRHHEGGHIRGNQYAKKDPRSRGHVMNQKRRLAGELTKRINRLKMSGN